MEAKAYSIMVDLGIVGGARLEDGVVRAFLWKDGAMTDFGTLGGDYSVANDINERG